MILTGSEIRKELENSNIQIVPFNESQLNPNSYNYRIGDELIVLTEKSSVRMKIPKTGVVLKPRQLYLASTYEQLGSRKYAMSLIGRSSLGRLGLFLQISANLGHTGSEHCWTLELFAAKPLKIYPHMIIGQISFWENKGAVRHYTDGYSRFNIPKQSDLKKL